MHIVQKCGKPITQQTIQQMTDDVMSFAEGTKVLVLAPMIQREKGEHKSVFEQLRKEGFVRARVDGVVRTLDEEIVLEKIRSIPSISLWTVSL